MLYQINTLQCICIRLPKSDICLVKNDRNKNRSALWVATSSFLLLRVCISFQYSMGLEVSSTRRSFGIPKLLLDDMPSHHLLRNKNEV